MILKGRLELIHEGRYTKHLEPYDQDVFSGEWTTFSKGKVTDFNLMLKGGATGSLTHQGIEQDHSAVFTAKTDHYFIYLASGTATLSNGNTAKAGDLLGFNIGYSLTIHAQEACNLVAIEVLLDQDKMPV
jgi:environmental stress-induced protein Ves